MLELNFEKDNCARRSVCPSYNNDNICNKKCGWWTLFNYATYTGNIPNRYTQPFKLGYNLDDKEAYIRLNNIKTDIVSWVNGGNNLVIKSVGCGNGKTSWACKMACSYIDKVMWKKQYTPLVLFISVPDIIYSRKQSFGGDENGVDELVAKIEKVDLVIWDDLGTTTMSQFDMEFIFVLLDRRVRGGKANIITTNVANEQKMIDNVGHRIFSRLCDDAEMITFIGMDRRASKWI